MRYCSRTDLGKVRTKNEDVLFADGRLFAVADGMGGHKGGEVASATAIKMIADAVRATPEDANAARLLAGAIVSANQEIHRKAHTASGPSGMGTTLTAGVLAGDVLTIGHVGDSRAYLMREGTLSQLTQDHSLVGELLRGGQITREEAFDHPNRNLLTKALGTSEDITADIGTHKLLPGDMVLFATDGLTSMVPDAGIAEILAGPGRVDEVCARLIEAANSAGGADNISVVLLDFADPEPFAAVTPVGANKTKAPGAKGGCGHTAAIILVPVLVLALLAAAGGYQVLVNTYYLGFSQRGRVTIFRGVPGSFLGLRYSQIYEETGVTREMLLPHELKAVEGNQVDDLDQLKAIVYRLSRRAPPGGPLPPGHPPLPGTPEESTATTTPSI